MPNERTLDDLINRGTCALKTSGVASPRRDAILLLRLAANLSPEEMMADSTREIDQNAENLFDSYVKRRTTGEPVSRIRGNREFWSLHFEIGSETLDPRPDSEVLVAAVLSVLTKKKDQALRILDLGTGSGCLLIALLSELRTASGVGGDVNPDAISIARRNAALNAVDQRAHFVVSDWQTAISGQFDVIVSNPPYIPTGAISNLDPDVRKFDPLVALDGGDDGLSCYRAIGEGLPALAVPGAIVAVEVGSGQSPEVIAILRAAGLGDIKEWPDVAGIQRCVTGTFG